MYTDLCDKEQQQAKISGENDRQKLVSCFWQQWQEHRESLYFCCLKLMNFNPTDAEDSLSQAMLKAWEKVQKYTKKITNVKAWLMQLTRNLCIDIIRKRDRTAMRRENIEWVGMGGEREITSEMETPDKVLEKEEKYSKIREEIALLPERFRETFILHFYQERSHQEIARMQGVSYDNVCKRISLARKILKEKLSSYFGEVDIERSPRSTPKRPKKLQPQEKEKRAIITSENEREERAEKSQIVIEKESRKSEKKEILETLKEDKVRSSPWQQSEIKKLTKREKAIVTLQKEYISSRSPP